MRAELMARLRETIAERGWTQTEAASHLGIGQSRVSDLVRGKWKKFSLDMLVTLATRAGRKVAVAILIGTWHSQTGSNRVRPGWPRSQGNICFAGNHSGPG
jgi:predicted XRE-type DNA-binding protein